MPIEVKVPSAGESVTEVQVAAWAVGEGEYVRADAVVVELETDKATSEVLAPVDGRLVRILKQEGEDVEVGDVLALMEEGEGEDAGGSAPATKSKGGGQKEPNASASPQRDGTTADPRREEPTPGGHPAGQPREVGDRTSGDHSSGNGDARVMPAAARLMAEHGLSASQVSASGPGGRVLKEDVQRAVSERTRGGGELMEARGGVPATAAMGGRDERTVRMTPIRRKIATRLVEAQQNAALLTTFNEIDMSGVMSTRKKYQEAFVAKHGVKLGFMSFFVKAVVDGLYNYPQVGAQIRGDELVYTDYCDIGIAVGGGKGLVVPVIRNAERLSFAEIEKTIADLGKRAQANKIGLEELSGGTFTITNGGIYGSLLSTPIVNPPQSGVLGMHNIVQRPVVVDGEVVARPMMYVALTYDHRVIDGREAVSFLKRIKETIEEPERMLVEV